jgi:hypothetical protein
MFTVSTEGIIKDFFKDLFIIIRVIPKVSSVCKYSRCTAVVTMVYTHAEFVDSVARHGRKLQTFKQCLHTVVCVYNV